MSGYKVEEPNEEVIYYNCDGTINMPLDIPKNDYWLEYSQIQRKRFKKVLYQLKEGWIDVFNLLDFMRSNGGLDLQSSNELMNKVHKIFIIQYKNKIDYYNEEKIKLRKNKKYLSKKINKLKTKKQNI